MAKAETIDVCLTFDTTGSMYPCLTQVRRVVEKTVKRLFQDIPGLRVAIKAHGDECDVGNPYITKTLEFSTSVSMVSDFIRNVEPTGGGDAPECYERVLQECRLLNWQAGKQKVIVMIGDDVPHPPSYPRHDGKKIDWRNELGLLLESGIHVYGVHAMPGCRRHSYPFYKEIAEKTGGFYLTLDQFASVVDIIKAICYQQQGTSILQNFKAELKEAGRLGRNMTYVVGVLLGEEVEEPTYEYSYSTGGKSGYGATVAVATFSGSEAEKGDLVPVPAGRFQVMEVDDDQPIKQFVEEQGATFKKGRGFYELTKSVVVQQYKEIVVMDKATGDIFTGPAVREMLGLPEQIENRKAAGRKDAKLRPVDLTKWAVFIQSTSVNRKLIGGTRFLYEVEDWMSPLEAATY